MCFLLNLSHCAKIYGHFCQILAIFTMPAQQIWSFHVTQDPNFKKFLFCPNSTFNIRKSDKISSGKALYFRSYQQKSSRRGDGKHPYLPVPLGLTELLLTGPEPRPKLLVKFQISSFKLISCKYLCGWHSHVDSNLKFPWGLP